MRRPDRCTKCAYEKLSFQYYLRPSGFAVGITYEPHNNVGRQVWVPVEEPWITAGDASWQSLSKASLGRYRYSPDGRLFHYSRGISRHGFAICLHCGRAASETSGERDVICAAEDQLEGAVRTIEVGAKYYSAMGERGLSKLLVDLLNAKGFRATAETDHHGHVDVTIEDERVGRWKYLGECKIYKGFEVHASGCRQVIGYCSGRELRAFVLGFFKQRDMYKKLEALRKQFDQDKPASQAGKSSDHRITGAFLTQHEHPNGRSIELLHFGCSVWVPPSTSSKRNLLYIKSKGIVAKGYETARGFLVLKNSQAVLEEVDSIHRYLATKRRSLEEQGVLEKAEGIFVFRHDFEFNSPSQAAGVVQGRAANGRLSWKDAQGRTLKDLQREVED